MNRHVYILGESLIAVSGETGEVTGITLEDGDVIRKADTAEDEPVNRGRAFVKLFPDVADELCGKLSGAGLTLCFAILPYIARDSGILKKRNGAFVSRQYLCDKVCGVTGKGTRTVDRGLAELVREGVLAKTVVKGRTAYIANPYVFQNGMKMNPTLLSLFAKSGWKRS